MLYRTCLLQWLVLGIESSCDDTAAAIVRGDGVVLAHEIASQVRLKGLEAAGFFWSQG